MTSEMAPNDQARYLLNKWTADEEYIDNQIDSLLIMRTELERAPFYLKPMRKASLMRQLNDLLVHIDSYKRKLAKQTIEGERPNEQVRHRSLWRRLLFHDRTHASIYFLVLPNRILWIRSGWLHLDFGVVRVTRMLLRDLVQKWHVLVACINKRGRNSASSSSNDEQNSFDSLLRNLIPLIPHESPEELSNECNSMLEQIADVLRIKSILNGLPKYVRSLVFHPDDVLHGFPFSAIQCEHQYLIERFAVSEGLDYSEQNMTRQSRERNALLVNVSTGSRDIPALPGTRVGSLPGTRAEIKKIKEWFAENNFNVRVLSDGEASKSALLPALSEVSFLHIACHGVFTPNDPEKTGLVLIPKSGPAEILTLKELSQLNLMGIDHVTLSSCWSADNFVLPGRWVFSFPEILRRAGVRSVLASLGVVEVRVAVSFMRRFYDDLEHHPTEEALRLTQLDCQKKTHSSQEVKPLDDVGRINTTETFYWAGYILSGDYRPL
jgi:CHAT domain-containing protein